MPTKQPRAFYKAALGDKIIKNCIFSLYVRPYIVYNRDKFNATPINKTEV